MPGTDLFHPMIVHFPVALILAALLADVLALLLKKPQLHKTALFLLITGTMGAIAAYLTGDLAEENIQHSRAIHDLVENHEQWAFFTMWACVASSLFRLLILYLDKFYGILKSISIASLFLCVVLVSISGYFGGELVYTHKIISNLKTPQTQHYVSLSGNQQYLSAQTFNSRNHASFNN